MNTIKDSNDLDCIFKPRSIAVIGTSRKPGTIGRAILHNLIKYGFQGPVYPVNPNAKFVHSVKCYSSILEIPEPIDLAVVVVPKHLVLSVVEECGQKGVRGVIVISAGFKEIGGEGVKFEKRLLEVIKRYGIRMVGPNCMGVINTAPSIKMDATFAPAIPLAGKIGFISQSGALGNIILEYARSLKLGFSKFVSVGNKADISGNDILVDLEQDPNTEIILIYLESFGNPRTFTSIARRLAKSKPIIAVKAGRTYAGARAASSHTGALGGMDIAVDALFEQCGVLRASTIDELFDYALAFSNQPLPKGNNVAIITNAGGPAIIATDACVSVGLKMSKFDKKTQKKLLENLPAEASIGNPVDILGDGGPARYEMALETVIQDDNVDAVITIFVPPLVTNPLDVALAIASVSEKYDKPVFGCFMGREDVLAGVHELEKHNVPTYKFPEPAARSIAAMYRYNRWKQQPKGKIKQFDVNIDMVKKIFDRVRAEGRTQLQPVEANRVLEAYGFTVSNSGLATTPQEAIQVAEEIGYPVVLKVISTDIIHKSDVGGVIVDIRNDAELKAGYDKIMNNLKINGYLNRNLQGIMVQEMVRGGKEIILGCTIDPNFGPLLMFGLGGVYVEILKDVSFRITPLTDLDALEMVRSIHGYPLLKGARGEPPSDIDAITEYIQRLSQLVINFNEIQQLDINPFIVFEKGKKGKVVDARMCISVD